MFILPLQMHILNKHPHEKEHCFLSLHCSLHCQSIPEQIDFESLYKRLDTVIDNSQGNVARR